MPGDDPVANLGGSAAAVAMAQAGAADFYKSTQSGMGQDTGQAGFWVPSFAPWGIVALTITTARTAVTRWLAPRSARITKIGFVLQTNASVDDQCDFGIYSADLSTLLGSTGLAGGRLNSGGPVARQVNLQAPVQLVGGQVYYVAGAFAGTGGTGAVVASCNYGGTSQAGAMFGNLAGKSECMFPSSPAQGAALVAPFVPAGTASTSFVFALIEG